MRRTIQGILFGAESSESDDSVATRTPRDGVGTHRFCHMIWFVPNSATAFPRSLLGRLALQNAAVTRRFHWRGLKK